MTVKYTCVVDQKRWFELALSWPKDLKKRYGKKRRRRRSVLRLARVPKDLKRPRALVVSCGRKERGKWRESERVGASTTGASHPLLSSSSRKGNTHGLLQHGLLQRTDHGSRRLIRPMATLLEYPIGQQSDVPYFYGSMYNP